MVLPSLDAATLEALCGVLGNTGDGLTGSEIGALLRQCQKERHAGPDSMTESGLFRQVGC
ncbi:hypothetical protein MEBOL_000323 [Melittangium boletus DSM 14713]|uniref:Uncharacterized protein n=1 Tax=Melittangium boletus DSM 14713 TaxID=1294270 RepID=A0A286NV14_9BACT|nr:hypothetical protein MEBOL_000323 [Melittangium boletus DSM 14713]